MTNEPANTDIRSVLSAACARAGVPATEVEPIRLGENALFRLPGRVVARITRPGQHRVAEREVHVARWLIDHGVPAVRPVDGVIQPVVVDGRAVTFWDELPDHRIGTAVEVAAALRHLHSLPPPAEFVLEPLDPFIRVEERIDAATVLTAPDRAWLHTRLAELKHRYSTNFRTGLPRCVVHGDASDTNIAVTDEGTIVLVDLERCTVGPPEWDLTSMAVELGYQWITPDTYRAFCARYGYDVTTWEGYPLLRDIRELRMTSWLAQQATEDPHYWTEAAYRLECLQGERGQRPWKWTPL